MTIRPGRVAAAIVMAVMVAACNPTPPLRSTVNALHLGGDGGHIYTSTSDGVLQVRVSESSCGKVRAVVSVNNLSLNPYGWPTLWENGVSRGFVNTAWAFTGSETGFWLWTEDGTICSAVYEARLVRMDDTTQIVGDLRCDRYC